MFLNKRKQIERVLPVSIKAQDVKVKSEKKEEGKRKPSKKTIQEETTTEAIAVEE